MLSAFGVFWTGEGLGVAWPGADLAIVGFAALFLLVAALAACRAQTPDGGRAVKILAGIARELIGLFVDDGISPSRIIAVIVIAALVQA